MPPAPSLEARVDAIEPPPTMVWGAEWTGDRVAERLVAVFRARPNTPIYSPRKGVFEPSHPIDGLELITAVQLCLGREMEPLVTEASFTSTGIKHQLSSRAQGGSGFSW